MKSASLASGAVSAGVSGAAASGVSGAVVSGVSSEKRAAGSYPSSSAWEPAAKSEENSATPEIPLFPPH